MIYRVETGPRSHRPSEAQEHYLIRLAHARLKKFEMREIEAIYARIDADRAANGLPPAERAPWSPADILEWQDLKPLERFLDLETFASAADHATNPPPALIIERTPTTTPVHRVLNKSQLTRGLPDGAIFIGRGSKWGNPFRIGPDGNRDDVIAKHEHWLAHQNQLLRSIDELEGRDLVCYCAPHACHGHLLLKLANASREDRIAWWKQIRVAH